MKINEKSSTGRTIYYDYFLIISFVFWLLLPQISQLVNDFGNENDPYYKCN